MKRWLLAPLWLALADRKYPSGFQISVACRKWELGVGDDRNCWYEEDTMQMLAFIIKLDEDDGYTKYDLKKGKPLPLLTVFRYLYIEKLHCHLSLVPMRLGDSRLVSAPCFSGSVLTCLSK